MVSEQNWVASTDEEILSFEYKPLHGEGAIRLVTLQPSSDRDAMIRCSITHTTLDECGSDTIDHYTAISYVWGDRHDKVTILVDNTQFEITRSLWHALQDIRDSTRPRHMWIDSICINQNDQAEKSTQVAHMWTVYGTADHTIIYLGAFTDYWSDWATQVRGNDPENLTVDALEHFIGHAWFRRIWCFQELVFSKDPWLQCGSIAIRWESLAQLVNNLLLRLKVPSLIIFYTLHQKREQVRGDQKKWSEKKFTHVAENFYQNMKELVVARRALGVSDPHDMIFAHLGIAGIHYLRTDNVHLVDWIRPDYSLSTQTIFENFAAHLLSYGHYELFGMAEQKSNFECRSSDYPSWTVDWTSPSSHEGYADLMNVITWLDRIEDRGPLIHHGMSSKGWPTPSPFNFVHVQSSKHGILAFAGQLSGSVTSISGILLQQGKPNIETSTSDSSTDTVTTRVLDSEARIRAELQPTFAMLPSREEFVDSTSAFNKAARHFPVYVHELTKLLLRHWSRHLSPFPLREFEIPHSRVNESSVSLFKYFARRLLHVPADYAKLSLQELFPVLVHRRLAILDAGSLFLVPGLAQVGDVICRIEGSKMPLLLRPVDGYEHDNILLQEAISAEDKPRLGSLNIQHYLFVGECWEQELVNKRSSTATQHGQERQEVLIALH